MVTPAMKWCRRQWVIADGVTQREIRIGPPPVVLRDCSEPEVLDPNTSAIQEVGKRSRIRHRRERPGCNVGGLFER